MSLKKEKIMKILILAVLSLALFSCDKVNKLIDVPDQLDKTNDGLNHTNENTTELKRLTIVNEMEKKLLDNKNYKKLSPVPVDLMEPAKLAAENFTADEVVQWIHLKTVDVNDISYEDNFGKASDASNPEAVQFEMDKVGVFNAMTAVSGFLPDATIDQLITKVYNSEEYTGTVLNILAMRVYFLQNVMMKEEYASSKLTDIGTVETAIKYNQWIEKVTKLPFAAYVSTKITGFSLLPDFNAGMTFGLEVATAKSNWKNISRGMDTYLKVVQFSNNTQDSRVNNARAKVAAGLQAYDAQPAVTP